MRILISNKTKELKSKNQNNRPSDFKFDDFEYFADAIDFLNDSLSIFDRVLRDLCVNVISQRENLSGVVVVHRSEVPKDIISPPYLFDVALDYGNKLGFISHRPRNSSYLSDWNIGIDEEVLRMIFDVSQIIHNSIPEYSQEDFLKNYIRGSCLDWIGNDFDNKKTWIRFENSAFGNDIIWGVVSFDGLYNFSKNEDLILPINLTNFSRNENGITLHGVESDLNL